jgi:hypothetical protein
MGDGERPQVPTDEPVYRPSFHFAGVEIKPDDDPRAMVREQILRRVRGQLWVNSIGSVFLGLVPLFILSFVSVGLGLLGFYIGFSLWWGIRDAVHASTMDEHHPLSGFIEGVFGIQWILGGLGVILVSAVAFIAYNLLGGGVYGLYKLIRKSSEDLEEYAPRR